jgi:hypothetical protein
MLSAGGEVQTSGYRQACKSQGDPSIQNRAKQFSEGGGSVARSAIIDLSDNPYIWKSRAELASLSKLGKLITAEVRPISMTSFPAGAPGAVRATSPTFPLARAGY